MSKYIYMAGLMDGEGTIGIARNRASDLYRKPYISISTSTIPIQEWLLENFGGHVSISKKYQEHHTQAYSWKLRTVSPIMELLREIRPYMLETEKIRRADLILNEYASITVRNGKYTEEEKQAKLNFERRFLNL